MSSRQMDCPPNECAPSSVRWIEYICAIFHLAGVGAGETHVSAQWQEILLNLRSLRGESMLWLSLPCLPKQPQPTILQGMTQPVPCRNRQFLPVRHQHSWVGFHEESPNTVGSPLPGHIHPFRG